MCNNARGPFGTVNGFLKKLNRKAGYHRGIFLEVAVIATCLLLGPLTTKADIAGTSPLPTYTITQIGDDVRYDYIEGFAIDNNGRVAFTALNTSNYELVVAERGSDIYTFQIVFKTGDLAPGTSDTFRSFQEFGSPILSDSGQMMFKASLETDSPAVGSVGFWAGTINELQLAARRKQPAPDIEGDVTFYSWENTSIPNNYRALFSNNGIFLTAVVLYEGSGSSNSAQGVFWDQDGELHMLAREGVQPEGLGKVTSLTINSAGSVAISTAALGEPYSLSAIWTNQGNTLIPVVKSGDYIPGSSEQFTALTDPDINSSGQIVFRDSSGIWVVDSGNLIEVARVGEISEMPGSTLYNVDDPIINNAGHVVFKGIIHQDGGSYLPSLWTNAGDGTTKLLFKRGDQAPQLDEGVTFKQIVAFSSNAADQIAIIADLSFNNESLRALYVTDPVSGELILVACTGQPFELSEGDVRIVSYIDDPTGDSGGDDGQPRWFNDDGAVLYRIGFTDDSGGLFVTRVPEPAVLGLLTLGFYTILRKRPAR